MNINKVERENLSRTYQEVLHEFDSLMSEYKIQPMELHEFVVNNLKDMMDSMDLFFDSNNSRVVLDVVNHLKNAQDDGILVVESFSRFMQHHDNSL